MTRMPLSSLRSAFTAACLAALLSCGSDRGAVVVASVTGIPAQVKSLRAGATLDSKMSTAMETFTGIQGGAARIAFQLPLGATGAYVLSVDGLQDDGCALAHGQATTTIASGQYEADLT